MLTATGLVLRFVTCLFLLVLIGASVWGPGVAKVEILAK